MSIKISIGMVVDSNEKGDLVVLSVNEGAAAAKAGIQKEDVLKKIDSTELKDKKTFIDCLKTCEPGQNVEIEMFRPSTQATERVSIKLEAKDDKSRLLIRSLGLEVYEDAVEKCVIVSETAEFAVDAGLRVGDVVRALNGTVIRTNADIKSVARAFLSGETINFKLERDGKPVIISHKVAGISPASGPQGEMKSIALSKTEESLSPKAMTSPTSHSTSLTTGSPGFHAPLFHPGINPQAPKEDQIRSQIRVKVGVTVTAQHLDKHLDMDKIVVESVQKGEPAEQAGVKPGDVILGIDGRMPVNMAHYLGLLTLLKPGHNAMVKVERNGKPLLLGWIPRANPDYNAGKQTVKKSSGGKSAALPSKTGASSLKDVTKIAATAGQSVPQKPTALGGLALIQQQVAAAREELLSIAPELGLGVRDEIHGHSETVAIFAVAAESPAALAGIKTGDRISKMNGKSLKSKEQYDRLFKGLIVGDKVTMELERDYKTFSVAMLTVAALASKERVAVLRQNSNEFFLSFTGLERVGDAITTQIDVIDKQADALVDDVAEEEEVGDDDAAQVTEFVEDLADGLIKRK